jgi:lactate racemase
MKTRFAFGKHGLDVALPDSVGVEVIHSRSAAALADPVAALNAALDNPIASRPLAELAAGKRTAAISVCDITRPAPNSVTLPPLLERLHRAGIPVEGVTILIATGLHRGATDDEIRTILGAEIAAKYRVVNHDATQRDQHRYLGTSKSGTPAWIDERFMAADLHLTLGFIEQHLMLGFSGGRKLVVPGVAAQETIKVIHSPKFMREPLATEGSIAHNPLHRELLEIAAMARHDFILDVTLTPAVDNQDRRISGVFAGDPVKAHAAGVEFVESTYLARLDEPVDAVVTSSAGYPLDLTFYQTVKGITAASHIVKPGGTILLVGECAEGIGSPAFSRMLADYKGPQEFLDSIRDTPVVHDQWQLERLALADLKHRLLFYTPGASSDQLGSLAPYAFDTLAGAVTALLSSVPAGGRVALIPEGPYTYTRAEQLEASVV